MTKYNHIYNPGNKVVVITEGTIGNSGDIMRIREKLQIYTLALLSVAMAAFLLVHFTLIWVYGKFYIYESNHLVLFLETTMMISILCFSICCLGEQLRKR